MFPTGFQFFCNKLATLDNTSTRACTTVYPEYIILEMEKKRKKNTRLPIVSRITGGR